jgi:tetratricopeptide (TPR) repeat protein
VNRTLKRGMEFHRQGRVVEARECYREALAEEPTNPEIHHYLGVAFDQLGERATAIDLLERSVALAPNSTEQAHADALHNLGVLLLRERRLPEAEAMLRRALGISPRGRTMAALGDVLRHAGRLKDAVAQYEQAVAADPALADVRGTLARLYLLFGRTVDALSQAKTSVATAPHDPDAYLRLGRLLLDLERPRAALRAFAAGSALAPNHPRMRLAVGQACLKAGKYTEAVRCAGRAMRLDPSLTDEAKCLYAAVQLESGDPEGAAATYRGILLGRPDCREARVGLAKALLEQGDAPQAAAMLKSLLEETPQSAALHAKLGDLLMKIGDDVGAAEAFRSALKHNPRCAAAYAGLTMTLRGKTDAETRRRLEELVDDKSVEAGERALLGFSLAQLDDGRGDFESAAQRVAIANALQRQWFAKRGRVDDPAEHRRFVDRLCEVFDKGYFRRVKGMGDPSERPVFVVGMPRSGTTLVESILASHPEAFGAGERGFVQTSLVAAAGRDGKQPLDQLATIGRDAVQAAAKWHLGRLLRLDGGKSLRVVDKLPDNALYLGWIATVFPNAKVILCRRDPRDAALSCWMTHFARLPWTTDLEQIAARFNDHARLMDCSRQALPLKMFEIDYEDLVTDQSGATKKLLEWIGLPWDDACLAFHKSDRAVQTASMAQVRRPIYGSSVGRWKNYEKHLKPLFDRLSPRRRRK